MRSLPVALLLVIAIVTQSKAQKVSDLFNPILKEAPSPYIVQHIDGNYLIFGNINYYANELSGALIKVDKTGKLVADFQKVFTDQMVAKVIVLPTGKMLILGAFKNVNGERTEQIVRLNADGSVDPSFYAVHEHFVNEVIVQSTGKIITISGTGSDREVRRLNEDGSRDFSFNTFLGDVFKAITGNDDKIYIGNNKEIYRLTPDGAIDNSFTYASDPSITIGKFAQQDDGKLVVITSKSTFTPTFSIKHTLLRLHVNGSLDDSFHAGEADQHIEGCVIRTDGKMVITGYFTTFDSKSGSAFELNADGSTNRVVLTTDSNAIYSIYGDRDQNIFITGNFRMANGTEGVKFMAKLKTNYELDLAFKIPVARTAGSTLPVPMAAQSDGKVLVGGAASFLGVSSDSSRVVRLLRDGSVDHTFKPAINSVLTNVNSTRVNSITVQSDDKIILGGNSIFKGSSPSLGRLLPNGLVDNTFQVGAGVYQSTWPGTVQTVLVHDSKTYVAGMFNKFNGAPCQSLVILNEAGQMIGPEQHAIPANAYIQDLEIQSDGKMVIMGEFSLSPADNRRFIRLNVDGSIDDTFALKTIEGNNIDLEIDMDDNIIVTGNLLDLVTGRILKRFKPDGAIDPSLNLGSGFKGYNFLTGYFAKSLHDNRLAVGGYFSTYRGISTPSIVILEKDGTPVPMEIPFDSTSYAIAGMYEGNVLHMAGRFSRKGEQFNSGATVVFPVGEGASNYNVTALSDSSMLLSWDGKFSGADRIVVEKSTPDASSFTVAATIAPNVTSYELRQLNDALPYHVRIKGVNDFYASAYLSGKDTTHIAPQIALPATDVTLSSFVANWKYIPGTDSCVVQVSNNNFAGFLNGYENRVVKSGSLAINELEEGTMYQYRVKRFKNGKSSAFSSAIIVNVITALEEKHPLSVDVYPNPVADELTIELPDGQRDARVLIHTMNGNLVGEYFVQKGRAMINAERFPMGIFVLTVSSEGETRKFKLVRTTEKL